MDDGSLGMLKYPDGSTRATMLRLHTNISKEENQLIIDYFNEV